MRCILSNAYFISPRLIAVTGLKCFGENFETIIGLVSGAEEIVLCAGDWIRLMNSKRDMDLYFLGFAPLDLNLSFPDFEILFANHGEKQIVIRSKKTWSFIRLSESEFSKLYDFSDCIDSYIQKLCSKRSFSNFRFFELVQCISQTIKNKQTGSDVESIKAELSNWQPEDHVTREIKVVYKDYIIREIRKKVEKHNHNEHVRATSYDENIDVPF